MRKINSLFVLPFFSFIVVTQGLIAQEQGTIVDIIFEGNRYVDPSSRISTNPKVIDTIMSNNLTN